MKSLLTSKAQRWAASVAVATVAALLIVPTFADAQAQTPTGQGSGVRPTIVLEHGAWADASSWNRVIPLLQQQGYTVDAPPNPLAGLASDAAYLRSYLSTVNGPIILVGHSYGGAVITNAATGNPNVKALVYVDAFAPAAGETLEQLTFSTPGSCLAGGGDLSNVFNFVTNPSQPAGDYDLYLKIPPGTDYAGFDACFATFVPPRKAAMLAVGQRPLAVDAFTTPSGTPAWQTIASWALIGTDDQAIPPAELTFMAQRANSHITYVRAGHLSMIMQPETVAGVITEAAQTEG